MFDVQQVMLCNVSSGTFQTTTADGCRVNKASENEIKFENFTGNEKVSCGVKSRVRNYLSIFKLSDDLEGIW